MFAWFFLLNISLGFGHLLVFVPSIPTVLFSAPVNLLIHANSADNAYCIEFRSRPFFIIEIEQHMACNVSVRYGKSSDPLAFCLNSNLPVFALPIDYVIDHIITTSTATNNSFNLRLNSSNDLIEAPVGLTPELITHVCNRSVIVVDSCSIIDHWLSLLIKNDLLVISTLSVPTTTAVSVVFDQDKIPIIDNSIVSDQMFLVASSLKSQIYINTRKSVFTLTIYCWLILSMLLSDHCRQNRIRI
ncbi:hypothetical protein GEMRC1_007740 [Eukaryota sp. GEM-RC1]